MLLVPGSCPIEKWMRHGGVLVFLERRMLWLLVIQIGVVVSMLECVQGQSKLHLSGKD
jgi:hypothetical protein